MAFSTHKDYRICRACLTAQTSFSYFIFEHVSADIYCFCTSVQVSKDEQLPRGICNSCYELLNKYSEFKQTCLQSQATLLDLEKDYKIKIEIKTDCVQNCELNDSQGKEIKTEILDNAVKVEDEEIGHDYIDEVDHHAEIKLPTPELLGDKHFTRKAKKLVKSKQHKEIKPKVKKKKFIYTCDVCQKKFNFKERFEAHKLEHEGKITTIHCSPCNKTFVTWSGLKRHKESEHTQVSLESLKCPTCGKIFKSRQTLKMHEKVHGNRKLIMCDVCGRGLTSSVILRAHLETHKENRERSFTCNQCGKQFFTKMILQSHVTRRHSGRKFICQVCSCTFTDKYNLSKHLHIHEGNKLYKCEICNNSYATHSTLTEHKRLHSGERPYVCNYCLKAFVSRKRLTDHVRIHTGDKPHKCTLCEQRFTQRGTLKRHMKVHDRPASTLS